MRFAREVQPLLLMPGVDSPEPIILDGEEIASTLGERLANVERRRRL